MRLFAAVWPTAEVRAAVSATVQRMREHPDAEAWRWVRPEHWHITVAFYGRVTAEQMPDLSARLARVAERRAPFDLKLGRPGRFGARVLWLGLDGDSEALRRLADGAAAAGRRAGVAMEERRFRAHLTLARSRCGGVAEQWLDVAVPPTEWPVRQLRLVRSESSNQVRYETLSEFGLVAD